MARIAGILYEERFYWTSAPDRIKSSLKMVVRSLRSIALMTSLQWLDKILILGGCMQYIYHGVPNCLEGNILYPLFSLKEIFPSLFSAEIKKYDDHPKRKELPFKKINKLNCPRGEVLHFSPIHPSLIFQALKTVFPDGNRSVKFFKIPIIRAQGHSIVLFDMNREGYEFGKEDPDHFFDFVSVDSYRELKVVPPEAYTFFNEWKERGERGAPAWGKIPHVFIRGPIDVTECEIIDWRDPVN